MKCIIEQSYNEFVGKFEVYQTWKSAQAKGYEAHHIIPRAVQIRERGEVYDHRCIRLTSLEHILAHYLYAKEHPEDIEEFVSLNGMLNTRAKELLADEKKFLEELPQMAEMRKKGYEKVSESMKGRIVSEETRKKQSEQRKGRTPWIKGRHHTEETKKKWSEQRKGKFAGEKNPFYGKRHTEEQKKKWSDSRKGKTSPMKGKHQTEEAKKKMSEYRKGKFKGEENGNSKKVYQYDLKGELINVFNCGRDVARELNISPMSVSHYCNGITSSTHRGYILSFSAPTTNYL
jgi:hypothetical protein